MAALSPVVHSLPSVVNGSEPHLLESRRIGLEMVCDEMARSKALLLQKLTHQFLGSSFVPAGLDQAVKNLALSIDSSPLDTPTFRQLRRTSRPDATAHVGEAGVSEDLAQSLDQTGLPTGGLFRS